MLIFYTSIVKWLNGMPVVRHDTSIEYITVCGREQPTLFFCFSNLALITKSALHPFA